MKPEKMFGRGHRVSFIHWIRPLWLAHAARPHSVCVLPKASGTGTGSVLDTLLVLCLSLFRFCRWNYHFLRSSQMFKTLSAGFNSHYTTHTHAIYIYTTILHAITTYRCYVHNQKGGSWRHVMVMVWTQWYIIGFANVTGHTQISLIAHSTS